MNRQTPVKINGKMAFFIEYSWTKKSKHCCHPPFHLPIFCRHSLKLLSPTLSKLLNWILLSPPSLSSDPDTPPKKRAPEGARKTLDWLISILLCQVYRVQCAEEHIRKDVCGLNSKQPPQLTLKLSLVRLSSVYLVRFCHYGNYFLRDFLSYFVCKLIILKVG